MLPRQRAPVACRCPLRLPACTSSAGVCLPPRARISGPITHQLPRSRRNCIACARPARCLPHRTRSCRLQLCDVYHAQAKVHTWAIFEVRSTRAPATVYGDELVVCASCPALPRSRARRSACSQLPRLQRCASLRTAHSVMHTEWPPSTDHVHNNVSVCVLDQRIVLLFSRAHV